MNLEPEVTPPSGAETTEFAEQTVRKPLEFLRDTERSLRLKTVETIAPILPAPITKSLQNASTVADTSLDELAEIDIDAISDEELRPARIFMGLTFAGFSALAIVFLMLYLTTMHPELTPLEGVSNYWYQYVFFVCLGVAGMFMLGREAMRSSKI